MRATFLHGVTRIDEHVDGLILPCKCEQLVQLFEKHGLLDANSVAVNVELDKDLRGGENVVHASAPGGIAEVP